MITVNTVAGLASARPGNGDIVRTRGYSVVGTGENEYRYDRTSSATIDNVFVINGPGGRGRYIATNQEVVDVTQAGALPNNPADAVAAIQAVVNALKVRGGGIIRFTAGSYSLISTTVFTEWTHVIFDECENITIDGYGATLVSNHIQGNATAVTIFGLDGCRNVEITGLSFECGHARTAAVVNTYGAGVVDLRSTSRDGYNITMRDLEISDAYFTMRCHAAAPYATRCYNIGMKNVHQDGGFYGVLFQENGDGFTCEGFRTSTLVRSYFPFGVDNHNVEYVADGSDQFSDCLIKAYARDTTNVTVKARMVNNISSGAHLTIESQHDPATQPSPGVLRNITVDIDDTDSSVGTSIRFAYYNDPGGILTPTVATTIFDNIVLSGSVNGAFDIQVTQTPLGRANIDNLQIAGVAAPNVVPDFWEKIADPVKTYAGSAIYQNQKSIWFRNAAESDYAGVISTTGIDNFTLTAFTADKALQLAAQGPNGVIDFIVDGAVQGTVSTGGIDLAAGNAFSVNGVPITGGSGSSIYVNAIDDHGATGDGVADDTAELQAAINASVAAGKMLYLPPGTYLITDTLTVPAATEKFHMFGAGPASTIIDARGLTNVAAIDISDSLWTALRQFKLLGDSSSGHGIVGIDPNWGTGSYLPQQVQIERLFIQGFTGQQTILGTHGMIGGATPADDVTLDACGIFLAGGLEIKILDTAPYANDIGCYIFSCGTPRIERGTFDGNKVGILCQNNETPIYRSNDIPAASTAVGETVQLVVASPRRNLSTIPAGGLVTVGSRGAVIEENKFKGCRQAIVAESDSSPVISNNWIRADILNGILAYGPARIENNTFEPAYDQALLGPFTFTTNSAVDDKLDVVGHPFQNGDEVVIYSTGNVPAGIFANTVMFVINRTANDFELSATSGGAALNITDDGTGTHSIGKARRDVYYNMPAGTTSNIGVVRDNAFTIGGGGVHHANIDLITQGYPLEGVIEANTFGGPVAAANATRINYNVIATNVTRALVLRNNLHYVPTNVTVAFRYSVASNASAPGPIFDNNQTENLGGSITFADQLPANDLYRIPINQAPEAGGLIELITDGVVQATVSASGIDLAAGNAFSVNGTPIVGGGLPPDDDYGDISITSGVWNIDAGVVTYAKMQDVSATSRILGRITTGAGDVEELTAANVLTIIGVEAGADVTDATNVEAAGAVMVADTATTGYGFVVDDDTFAAASDTKVPTAQSVKAYVDATAGGVADGDKGDITVSASGATWTIDAGAVSYAKIQDVSATNRILGRITTGAGDIEELTAANVRTIINVEDGADVTDATNVEAAGAVMVADTSTAGYGFVIDEDTMVSDSATKVPTQQSVKAYVDTEIAGVAAGGDGTFTTLTVDSATPSVTSLRLVNTANTVGTAITNLTGGTEGQYLEIHVNDANTSFVNNSNLALIGGVNIPASSSPYIVALRRDATQWKQEGYASQGHQFATSADGSDNLTLQNTGTDADIIIQADGTGVVNIVAADLQLNGTPVGGGGGLPAGGTVGDLVVNTGSGTGSWSSVLSVGANGSTITGGTVVNPATPLAITQTWNDAADTFDAIDVNVTNTNSAAASRLINLRIGGTSQFAVTRSGAVTSNNYTAANGNDSTPTFKFATGTAGISYDSGAQAVTVVENAAPQVLMGRGGVISNVPLFTKRSVEANTAGSGAPNVLDTWESFRVETNEGATAKNYHTLPSASAGLTYTFVVADADGLRVTSAAGDEIRIGNKLTATAGYVESTTIGDTVTLVAINAQTWVATSVLGTWTDGTFTFTLVSST